VLATCAGVTTLIALSGCATFQPASSARQKSADTIAGLLSVGIATADSVWPGYNLAGTQIHFNDGANTFDVSSAKASQFVDPDLQKAVAGPLYYSYLFAGTTKRIELKVVPGSQLNVILAKVPYPLEQLMAQLAIHEGFHAFEQNATASGCSGKRCSNWVTPSLAYSDRTEALPVDAAAREMRFRLFDSIRNAAKSPGEQASYLGHAAYYYGQWTSTFAAQARALESTDTLEGSAEFVADQTLARMRVGAHASASRIRDDAVKQLFTPYAAISGDGESYALGAAAGLVLNDRKIAGWQNRVARGETPVSILLDGVKPVLPPTAALPSDYLATQKVVIAQSVEAQKQVKFLIAAFAARSPLLAVPFEAGQGSAASTGDYSLAGLPAGVSATTGFTGSFALTSGKLRLTDATIASSQVATACGAPAYLIPATVLPHSIGAYATTKVPGPDGQTIYCATAKIPAASTK